MERILEIQKFRNIGLNEKEKLVLNSSMKKGEIGNLIIVVGANNSGKSNVLDALTCFGDKKLERRDITTLSYLEEDRKPSLTLITKDGKKDSPEEFSYSITYGVNNHIVNFPEVKKTEPLETKENNKRLCDLVVAINGNYGIKDNEWFELSQVFSREDLKKSEFICSEEKVLEKLRHVKKNSNNYNYQYVICELRRQCAENKVYKLAFESVDNYQILEQQYQKKYGVRFMPTILRYKEKNITNSDLRVPYQNLSSNSFMKSLFQAIKVEEKDVMTVYSDYERLQDKGVLKTFAHKVNKKLKEIAKKFNALYFLEDDTYKFEIDCESTQVCFVMFRNSESISLDYQSTGFKWFFNLYFNLLTANSLKAGDIIIMDEPATNLHPYGQVELRKFLKEFAIKNDLTIILATHSPFLIDVDYLDELRVVTMNDNISSIENDFSTINPKDPDSLKPIKTALTVGNHVLYDPDKKVVFVEGITDYNYMVAFKDILEYKDIVFLPINGIGNSTAADFKDKQVEISKTLMKIKKHNPILMVDGDKAGKAIQSINKKDSGLDVFTLSDADPNFKNIEDLFSKDDAEKFGVKAKRSYLSALFKTHHANKNEISEQTLDNFKKVFDHIID